MMKRVMTVLFVACMLIPAIAFATVDLSDMSFEELIALKDQIDLAIWSREEWQEVKVPSGVYVIGEDIPAGKWTIKASDGINAVVKWGDVLAESGVDLDYGKLYEYQSLYSPTYSYYQEDADTTEVTYDMKEGQYFIVSSGTVLFSPYAGKQSLGFK